MPPPSSPDHDGDLLYEAFYGFHEPPFATTTDPRFFYLSTSHRHAYTELVHGLRRREGLLMITGETGTGKTTLCRAVIAGLGDRTFSAILVNPYMTGAEVLRMIVRDFGLVSRADLRRGRLATADVPQLLDTLEGFLTSLVPIEGRAVLVLDEAQSVAPAVLDQIRVLSNLEHDGRRLLDIILSGQPRLADTIRSRPLAALDERITRRVTLEPLGPADIPSYIQHRLGVAGDAPSVRFDAAAMQAIADLSQGLPRRVNVLCDRALQLGRLEAAATITAPLIRRAEETLGSVHALLPAEFPPLREARTAPGRPDDASELVVPAPAMGEATRVDSTGPAGPTSAPGSEPTADPEPTPLPPVEPEVEEESAPEPSSEPLVEPEATLAPTSSPDLTPETAGATEAAPEPIATEGMRPLVEPLPVPPVEPVPPAGDVRAERQSGFGPATVHPSTPTGGTRPDLAPPPSITEPLTRTEPETPVEAPLTHEPAPAVDPPAHAPVDLVSSEPARPAVETPSARIGQTSGFGPATVHPPMPAGGTRPDLAPLPSDRVVERRSETSATADTVAIALPVPGATAAAPPATAGHTSDADVDAPGDPFGPTDEETAARAMWLKRGGVASAVVLAFAIGYVGWAWEVRDAGTLIAAVPDRPALDRGTPAGPHPVPPPEELAARYDIRLRPWRPLPETPSNAAPPPQPGPPQLPPQPLP